MRYIFGVVLALAASFGTAFAGGNKVDVCHVTHSTDNPYVVISVADAAYDTHIGHGDVPYIDGACDDGGGPNPT